MSEAKSGFKLGVKLSNTEVLQGSNVNFTYQHNKTAKIFSYNPRLKAKLAPEPENMHAFSETWCSDVIVTQPEVMTILSHKRNSSLICFCFTKLYDWSKNSCHFSQRSKAKTNCDLLARVFQRLTTISCICFEFWLVHSLQSRRILLGERWIIRYAAILDNETDRGLRRAKKWFQGRGW